jgi:hypothetical protein
MLNANLLQRAVVTGGIRIAAFPRVSCGPPNRVWCISRICLTIVSLMDRCAPLSGCITAKMNGGQYEPCKTNH